MQALRILAAMVLLSSVLLSLAQQDLIVSKVFPANIPCRRDRAQRDVERQRITDLDGNENLLVLLYRMLYYLQLSYNPSCTINANHFLNV